MSDNTYRPNWLDMPAGRFTSKGAQLDMLGSFLGDGFGTLDLVVEAETAAAAPVVPAPADALPWPVATPLFGAEQLPLGA